jgi:hypothetical protein
MGRGTLSISRFCTYASVGRTTAFAEIKADRLIAHKRGRSTIILIEDADAWLQSLPRVRPSTPDIVVPKSQVMTRKGTDDRGYKTTPRSDIVEVDGYVKRQAGQEPATLATMSEVALNSSGGEKDRSSEARHRASSFPRGSSSRG